MRQTLPVWGIVLLVLSWVGCASSYGSYGSAIHIGEAVFPPTPDDVSIQIIRGTPTREYIEVGIVTARRRMSVSAKVREEDLIPELMKQARRLGATALIELTFAPYTVGSGLEIASRLEAKAVAIRWK